MTKGTGAVLSMSQQIPKISSFEWYMVGLYTIHFVKMTGKILCQFFLGQTVFTVSIISLVESSQVYIDFNEVDRLSALLLVDN